MRKEGLCKEAGERGLQTPPRGSAGASPGMVPVREPGTRKEGEKDGQPEQLLREGVGRDSFPASPEALEEVCKPSSPLVLHTKCSWNAAVLSLPCAPCGGFRADH